MPRTMPCQTLLVSGTIGMVPKKWHHVEHSWRGGLLACLQGLGPMTRPHGRMLNAPVTQLHTLPGNQTNQVEYWESADDVCNFTFLAVR